MQGRIPLHNHNTSTVAAANMPGRGTIAGACPDSMTVAAARLQAVPTPSKSTVVMASAAALAHHQCPTCSVSRCCHRGSGNNDGSLGPPELPTPTSFFFTRRSIRL